MARAYIEVPAKNGDHGYVPVLLDIEDAERLDGRRLSIGSHGYAQMWNRPGVILVHRWVMNVQPGTGYRLIVDHINRQIHDCRRSNLRLVTPSESNHNRVTGPRDLPPGIYLQPNGRYVARIQHNGTRLYLGSHNTQAEAAEAITAARAA